MKRFYLFFYLLYWYSYIVYPYYTVYPILSASGNLFECHEEFFFFFFTCCIGIPIWYKGSGRGRLGAPRPPWRVRVECEEVFVLELSGTHELHTINTTYQVADVRPSGPR